MIIAVDFDDTISHAKYPGVKLDNVAVDILRRAKEHGHKLILWTCRIDDALMAAVEACLEEGLDFDAINDNIPEQAAEWTALTGETDFSPKVYADYYIDEKAYPDKKVDWQVWDRVLNQN